MGFGLIAAVGLMSTAALGFDPAIDQAREPPRSWSGSLGLERLDGTFGFWAELRTPRFLNDRLVVGFSGGFGWFPGIQLAATERDPAVGPWSPFAHMRVRLELGLRIAESPHRMYLAFGPSVLFPARELSSDLAGPGAHGGLGIELFAGTRFRTFPVALVIELGGVAHLLRADARAGEVETEAPLATGLALSIGVRWYPYGGRRKPAVTPQ